MNRAKNTIRNPRSAIRNRKGRFIVLDGPDGSGKSTQARLLAVELKQRGIEVLLLREPGGTATGEAIRQLLLKRGAMAISSLAEALLFQAARAQLVEEVIRPALRRGAWVLCDRFSLSTLVYQGLAGGVPPRAVEGLSALATGGLWPDKYIVLWVPFNVGLQRRAHRAADRMESKGAKFLRAVAAAYKREALRAPRLYELVEATGTVETVQARIWRCVATLLNSSSSEERE
jgi:dTMP kinase